MKKNILIIMIAFALQTAMAQSNDIRTLKKAYQYRLDINESVLKQTKEWSEGCGILHSGWIENRNGKSIDLTGKVLFPKYNYTQLKSLCCGNYWVMTVDGKKGVLDKNGELLIPFEYYGFDFSYIGDGMIVALGANKERQEYNVGQQISYESMWKADSEYFENNGWVDRFAYYYNMEEYKKALFCIQFYNTYEQDLWTFSDPCTFRANRYSLLTYEMKKDYNGVINSVKHNNIPGTKYDHSSDKLVLKNSNLYASDILPKVQKEIDYINANYHDCIKLREAQVQQQHQRAEMASLILAGAAMATAAIITEQPQQQMQTSAAPSNTAAVPANDYSSSKSSSNSSSTSNTKEDNTYRWECTYCKGTGRETINEQINIGHYGLPNPVKVRCSECGKEYDKTTTRHVHQTCSHCKGKGYQEKKL